MPLTAGPHAEAIRSSWTRLLAPRYWPTWMALGTLRLLVLLPFPVQLALGRALGAILRRLPVRFVSIARRNIDLCLPELESADRERLLDRHFASLGIALMEIGLAWWSPAARLREMAQVEGLEHVREALRRGRGVILLTAHFTPLEIGGRILSAIFPINVLYRPTKNEALAYMQSRCRCRNGGRAIRRDDIRSMVAALEKWSPTRPSRRSEWKRSPSKATMPAASWPRCWSACRPSAVSAAAWGWPKMPKTPHFSRRSSASRSKSFMVSTMWGRAPAAATPPCR